MSRFIFRSTLDASYHAALERLVFFNPRQSETERAIVEVVDAYGAPMIVSDAAGIHVTVSGRQDAQCLFALEPAARDPILAGMVLFLRTSIDEISILHIAVADHFNRTHSGPEVLVALVAAVRDIAWRLRGVRRVRTLYVRARGDQNAERQHE